MRKKKIYFSRINRSNGHLVRHLWINNRLTVARRLVKHFKMSESDAFAFSTCLFSDWVADDAQFVELAGKDLEDVRHMIEMRFRESYSQLVALQRSSLTAFALGHHGFGVLRAEKESGFIGSHTVLFKMPVLYKVKEHNFIVPHHTYVEDDYIEEVDENGEPDYVHVILKESFSHTLRRAGEREGAFLWWQSSWKVLKAANRLSSFTE